ncbi:MAG TPA: ABC transporter ATP-binding protein [Candidatus Binatia bacterium]
MTISISKDLRLLARALSWKVGVSLGLALCVSLTEGVGLLMLVPMLQLIGIDAPQGTLDRIGRIISESFAAAGVRPGPAAILGLYILTVSARALLVRWQTVMNVLLQHDTVAALRQQLYRAIGNAEWLFLVRRRSSDFMYALTVEAERAGSAVYHLLTMLGLAAVTLIYILFALKISTAMTMIALICGTALTLLLRERNAKARRAGERISETGSALYAAINEHLSGIKTVKSHGAEKRLGSAFTILTERMRSASAAAIRSHAGGTALFEIGSVISLSLVLYVSLKFFEISGPEIMILLFLFGRLMPRFSNLHQNYEGLLNVLPAFRAVTEIQARCAEAAECNGGAPRRWSLRQEIRLQNVSFAYGKDQPVVLRGIDLGIRAGETTALVGGSGVGKTTIADLLGGLIVPDRGRVLLDGIPIEAENVRSWREHIAYVPQETFLFHDTIRENLLWAQPGASEEKLAEALRAAGAAEFVSGLCFGLDTVIGDRGSLLSGGEKQRLALARALLREPELLILDEATSALDAESEERIHRAIDELHGRTTILLITHRLSTLRHADWIHVVEQGRLVESGKREMLLQSPGGRFRKLCAAQGVAIPEEKLTPVQRTSGRGDCPSAQLQSA